MDLEVEGPKTDPGNVSALDVEPPPPALPPRLDPSFLMEVAAEPEPSTSPDTLPSLTSPVAADRRAEGEIPKAEKIERRRPGSIAGARLPTPVPRAASSARSMPAPSGASPAVSAPSAASSAPIPPASSAPSMPAAAAAPSAPAIPSPFKELDADPTVNYRPLARKAFLEAQGAERAGDIDRAIKLFEISLRNGDEHYLLARLAWLVGAHKKDFKRAEELMKRATALDGKNEEYPEVSKRLMIAAAAADQENKGRPGAQKSIFGRLFKK